MPRRCWPHCLEAGHPELVEQGENVRGRLTVCECPGWVRRPAMPAEVGHDQPEVLREPVGQRLPELTAAAEAVKKNEGLSRPALLVIHLYVVDAQRAAGGWSLLPRGHRTLNREDGESDCQHEAQECRQHIDLRLRIPPRPA